MSIHVPHPRDLPQTGAAASDAKWSRRGRTGVGICLIFVSLALALLLARAYEKSYITALSEIDTSTLTMANTENVFFTIFLIAGGFWNITARRSNSKAPLTAALVLSGLGIVYNIIDVMTAPVAMPNVIGLLFHAGIFTQTIRLLRLKPINPLLFYLP